MTTPLVSVIIPTYNRRELLGEAVASVQSQTFTDYELIIVDDGSTDDTAAYLHNLADQMGNRLKHIRQNNAGASSARNRGLELARGQWTAFLDSDDLWRQTKLERYMQAARELPHLNVWYGPMDAATTDLHAVPGRNKPCIAGKLTEPLFHKSFVHMPTVMARTNILLTHGGFDEQLTVAEDLHLWLRVSLHNEFGLIDEPLAIRRLHDRRLSKSNACRNIRLKVAMLERFYYTEGGRQFIDTQSARNRLTRINYSAGRTHLWSGQPGPAKHFLTKAIRMGGKDWIKAAGLLAIAATAHPRTWTPRTLPDGLRLRAFRQSIRPDSDAHYDRVPEPMTAT